MLKKLLGEINYIFRPFERLDVVEKDLFLHQQKYSVIYHSQQFLKNPNKTLFLVQKLKLLKSRHYYFAIAYALSYRLYHDIDYESSALKRRETLENKIIGIVNKEVLQKQQINDMLADLIARQTAKESVIHNTTKQINRIFEMKPIYQKTYILTKEQLIEHVFQSQEIQAKLRDLIIKVMYQEKAFLQKLLIEVMMGPGLNNTKESLTKLYSQQNFQQGLSNNLAGAIIKMLKNENNALDILKFLSQQ